MKTFFFPILCVLCVLCGSDLFAETLDSLNQKIRVAASQIGELSRQYEIGAKSNELRTQKAEALRSKNQAEADRILRQAYTAAEKLNELSSSINQWKQQKADLCRVWRSLYAKTIDDLLASAEREKDKNKKGQIGKMLQRYQTANLQLCAEAIQAGISQEWRALRIENYDGPNEIQQKIQLLQDISRDININIARLDQQYQNAVREQKTKERAQEFIQESTLFTENVIVHPGTGSAATLSVPTVGELSGPSRATEDSNPAQGVAASDPFNKEYGDEFKAQYQKTRTELMDQQKELQKRIAQFQNQAQTLQLP